MSLSGFENTKKLADDIQGKTKGTQISNTTGSDVVNAPIDDDLSAFNKGVETMFNIGNYHVMNNQPS